MNRPSFGESGTAFVVLSWNSEAYIEQCVRSILALSCRELGVWVVDNGSTDGTRAIISEIAASDDRLHPIYESRNLGTTLSRNKAIRAIPRRMDYVCVLDSDTVVNQRAFEVMALALADESIGVVGPTMMNSNGDVQLSGRNLPTLGIKIGKAIPVCDVSSRAARKEMPNSPIVDGLQDVGYLLSACWFMPVDSLSRVGLLDERIFYAPEDVDWCLRCHKAGLRVVHVHNARIVHEYQRLSHKKIVSKTNVEHVKGLAYFFLKHGYLSRPPQLTTYKTIENKANQ